MSISDEAVEAAHEQLDAMGAYVSRKYVRAALEAAAPHLMSAAWDEGRKHGAAYPYGKRGLATDDNPYRAAGAGE